jgi:hypothetical protein
MARMTRIEQKGGGQAGRWQMADGKWLMANGKMAKWQNGFRENLQKSP